MRYRAPIRYDYEKDIQWLFVHAVVPLEDKICPDSVARGKGLWRGNIHPLAQGQDRHSGRTERISVRTKFGFS